MIRVSVFIALACSFTAFAFAFEKRTIEQVEADIANITTQVTNLDNAIRNFPDTGGSLGAALGIHSNATSLEGAINQGTTDIGNTGTPFSDADCATILASIQNLEPIIIDALQAIVAKKPAFDALPLGGVSALIKQDLITLNGDTSTFENALITACPNEPEAITIKNEIDAAFATAIAAYS